MEKRQRIAAKIIIFFINEKSPEYRKFLKILVAECLLKVSDLQKILGFESQNAGKLSFCL